MSDPKVEHADVAETSAAVEAGALLVDVREDFEWRAGHARGAVHLPESPASLLTLVAEAYGKAVDIEPDEDFVIDRSLNSERFRNATGFRPEKWPDLVTRMRDFG